MKRHKYEIRLGSQTKEEEISYRTSNGDVLLTAHFFVLAQNILVHNLDPPRFETLDETRVKDIDDVRRIREKW